MKPLKNKLSIEQKMLLRYKLRSIIAHFYSFNLTKLAQIHRTDKYGGHFYTQHYQHFFRKFKFKKMNVLEIGVGGYDDPIRGGNSLRMWKSYFPFAKIFSIDIYDKSKLQENRIKIYKGSQVDENLLRGICKEVGEFDLIIDDGSHINDHVIKTFEYLFPRLKKGGYYVIEDTQTSYWKEYGGSSVDRNKEGTIYHYFKEKIDALNYKEFEIENYSPTYYDKNIVGVHFFHNMIFIHKNDNDEHSNYNKYSQ
ncbi:class I SAM-dependent methyltransferase [Flavobacterium oreochromis]|uniref:Methyltransferase n=1 Tax=Flavobacterium columnare TaxID=996 RepID=A0A246GDZ4_9FLAO|nr:class I SAM-dependent methyltransferase [Flavobacterium oreochromis]OWP79621.1 methyltransferase [Flavobacterium oreochromis]